MKKEHGRDQILAMFRFIVPSSCLKIAGIRSPPAPALMQRYRKAELLCFPTDEKVGVQAERQEADQVLPGAGLRLVKRYGAGRGGVDFVEQVLLYSGQMV